MVFDDTSLVIYSVRVRCGEASHSSTSTGGDLLRSNRTNLTPKGMWSFSNWIRTQIQQNRPADQMVRDLILAQGSYVQRGLAFAGGFIGAGPPLILYSIFQRQILSGISTTGLSGR